MDNMIGFDFGLYFDFEDELQAYEVIDKVNFMFCFTEELSPLQIVGKEELCFSDSENTVTCLQVMNFPYRESYKHHLSFEEKFAAYALIQRLFRFPLSEDQEDAIEIFEAAHGKAFLSKLLKSNQIYKTYNFINSIEKMLNWILTTKYPGHRQAMRTITPNIDSNYEWFIHQSGEFTDAFLINSSSAIH